MSYRTIGVLLPLLLGAPLGARSEAPDPERPGVETVERSGEARAPRSAGTRAEVPPVAEAEASGRPGPESEGPSRYVPRPLFGTTAPEARLGGGTRGGPAVGVQVLAPPSTGATVHGQPTLYWYAPHPMADPVEIALIDPDALDPLLEVRLPGGLPEGIHRISLAEHGVELIADRTYEWSVAVVHDPERRSADSFALATIVRIAPPGSLLARLQAAPVEARPRLYADAGLWYDAMDAVHRLLLADHPAPGLAGERRTLLEQARLPALVHERS